MPSFQDRSEKAERLVALIYEHFWNVEPCRSALAPVRYGYEGITTSEIRSRLRFCQTVTAKHVRFAPDSIIVNLHDEEKHHLLDYKVTQTPIYSPRRVEMIQEAADDRTLTSECIGQVEADALDNYLRLCRIGVKTAILDHCAYHDRQLLCEYADRIREVHRDRVTSTTAAGSGTPFINFDCRTMRTFAEFLEQEHGVQFDARTYKQAEAAILKALPVTPGR